MQILNSLITDRIEALKSCRYFSTLQSDLLTKLAQHTILSAYQKDENLFWQDEDCPGLFIIQQGSVKLFKISPQGRELIVRVLEKGETFNEVPVFDQGKNAVNATALEASQFWLVKTEAIQHVMVEHPELCQLTVLNLSQNLRMLIGLVEELSFYQVTHRLARLISQLSPEQLQGQTGPRLTQDDLAARLGTVREVVARSLRELERSGAIDVQRGRINIVDQQILASWLDP